MATPPFLSIILSGFSLDKFFDKLVVDDVFRYSSSYTFPEVSNMVERRGKATNHCQPGSDEYHQWGGRVVKIVANNLNKEQIFQFDPKHLDV